MASGKHLNVDLSFRTDTSQAQREIKTLQAQLDSLLKSASKSTGQFSLDEELQKASRSAIELKQHIEKAVNVNTGQLDVGALSKSFKQSGVSLEEYRLSLSKLGTEGNQVFSSLAKAILNAEVPLKQTNGLLHEFATTLKNTARWQISSSILHGFMGSLQSAYYYAQDLNESLNNIRIVTGKSTDEMADFAEQANEAAKALSTTTTEYTDAALIYYQQGLSDSEVAERTDTTIKLANVAREGAEEVSQQMTAIWNNFDDGSKSLEYYADVVTALGAATASSSAEIAEGLEKFAAVADTVGLSYEYATAALATVTATTRQSADIVGNAFKTLFARLEGLNLGETLDDGTDLNKYSEALDKVGINIKTVSGDMKSMDQILDEMGSKWNTLSKDQQIALAQTVAGVRQYTQLIALMDNWDFFQQNLEVAQGSEGSLQEQADIYAESWEAARDRVAAAAEEIYNQLLNDDFFIDLNNAFADTLSIISDTIDGIGGLQGALSGLGILITKLYGESLVTTLNNFFTTQGQRLKQWVTSQEEALTQLENAAIEQDRFDSAAAYESIVDATKALVTESSHMTENQQEQAKLELKQLKSRAEAIEQYEEMVAAAEKKLEIAQEEDSLARKKASTATKLKDSVITLGTGKSTKKVQEAIENYTKVSRVVALSGEEARNASVEFNALVKAMGGNRTKAMEIAEAIDKESIALKEVESAAAQATIAENNLSDASDNLHGSLGDLYESTEEFKNNLEGLEEESLTMGDRVIGFAQGLMSLSMAISTIKGLGNIWSDEDMSFGEKLLSTVTSLGIALPMLVTGFKALKESVSNSKTAFLNFIAGLQGTTLAEIEATGGTITLTGALEALKVSLAGIASGLLTILAPIALVVAAGAALTYAFNEHQKSLEATARAEADQTKQLKEEQDALVETKNNIVSLTESYDELTSKVKTNTDFTSDLRTQVFDLCNQYELYDLAIEALTEDYDDLTESIRKAQEQQDKKIIEASQETQSSAQSAIRSQIWANLDSSERDQWYQGMRTIDLGTFINSGLMDTLDNFGVEYEALGFGGHISLEDFVRAATEEHDAFIKALEENGSEQAQTLIDIINNNQELFTTYTDSVSKTIEARRDQAGLENVGDISSYKDYANAVENITNEIKDTFKDEENPEQSARKYAETWLSSYDKSFSEYAKKYALTETIANAIGGDLNEVSNNLSKYGTESLAFIASHTKQIEESGKTLEDFIKDTKDYLEIADNIQERDSVVGLLQSLASGEEYNSDQLANLFSEESNFGIKQEDFEAMTKGDQTVALLNYFSTNQQIIEENKEKTIAELENYKGEAEILLEQINGSIDELTIKEDAAGNENYIKNLFPELDGEAAKLAERIAKGEEETFTENEKIYADVLKQNEEIANAIEERKKALEQLNELYESRDAISEEINGYEAEKEALDEATSATTRYKAAHEGINAVSKDIDNIQSAYKSLSAIVETYNKNNGFTLDTLQSLLALDPMYLQALEMDGNQLSINEEYLVELTKARLEETKALVYQEGYNKLLALSEKDGADAAIQASLANNTLAASLGVVSEEAINAKIQYDNYVKSLGGSISKEQQAIIDDTEKRIQSIDNVINNLNSSSFKKIAGSSKSSGSQKDKKILEDEIDRYYDLKNAIQETTNSLEDYNKQLDKLKAYQDHYQGNTLVKSLKAQNELIKKQSALLEGQIKNYKAYAQEQANELDDLKAKIESYGGTFTGDVLDNYTQVMTDAVNAYNASIGSDSKSSSNKDGEKSAEKRYEKIKKALSRYQQLYYSEMAETEQKLADALQEQLENQLKIIENNFKTWETEVKLKLDISELKREWRDFLKGIEQDFRKIYKNLTIESKASTDNFRTYLDDASTRMKEIYDVEAEIRKMDAAKDSNGVVQLDDSMMFGSISEAQEKLKELQSELVDTGSSLQDLYEQVWDNYIDGLNQAVNNFEDIAKEIEHITNKLEYQKQLIELIYGDEAYDLMNKYYSAQQKNIEAQISSTRTQALFWEEQFNKAYQMNRDKHNVNLNDMSTWTEDMKLTYEQMISSQETLNSLVIEGIETLKDDYLNSIAKTLSKMDNAIWGMKFDELKEDWDFIQKKADEYLDDIEGAYKIQSLANKINESIAETTSLKAQQKLAKLREEELEMLREKENLTQSDIDLAEARYQIALKEIALEEAQNNKTSMKLSRDTSGNWTYQYVADEEDIANKQQELLDAYNNLYERADEAYQHAMELSMEMYEEYKEKILAIAEDITLSEEEKMIKIQELQDLYFPEIQAAMENAQIYEQETIMATAGVFAEVCAQNEEAYTALTDLQKELVDAVRDQHLEDYEDIRDAIIDNYEEIGAKAEETFQDTNQNSKTTAAEVIRQWDKNTNDSVKGAMNEAFTAVQNYTRNFENELYNLEKISGKTIIDAGGVVSDINAIGDAVDEVANKTQDMTDQSTDNLDTLRNFVNEVESAWDGVISKIQEAINELQEYLSLSESAVGVSGSNLNLSRGSGSSSSSSPSSRGSGSGSSGGSGKGSSINGSGGLAVGAGYGAYPDPYGASNTLAITYNNKVKEVIGYDGTTVGKTEALYDWAIKHGYSGFGHAFNTGGYTGEWGSDGRLAILHQKEYVLNADDTKNILNAVQTVRDMAGLNESISQTIASSIGQLVMRTLTANSGSVNASTNNNTNNVFNITAEFPNADDVQTIKDAILSLPNLASQFINEN